VQARQFFPFFFILGDFRRIDSTNVEIDRRN